MRTDRAAQPCGSCVYWRLLSATCPDAGSACHFCLDRGHARRRAGGTCLEYTGKTVPSPGKEPFPLTGISECRPWRRRGLR